MIWKRRNKRDGMLYYFVRYEIDNEGHRKKEQVPLNLDGRPVSKQDATDFLTKRKAEVNAGTWVDPHAPKPEVDPDTGPTFAQFAKRFLAEHPGKRRSNHYPSNVGELVKHFGDRPLRQITRADLDAYRVALETTARPGRPIPKSKRAPGGPERTSRPPLSSTTVLKRLRALHRVFKLAVRWGELPFNPAADLEKPSPNKGGLRYLSREEFGKLEETAPPWLRPMLRMAVVTGLRLKEVALLTWGEVDRKGRTLTVAMETKTGARTVPLNREAEAVLDEAKTRRKQLAAEARVVEPHVFVDDAGHGYGDEDRRREISEATRAAARAAGLDGKVGFHTLRHTAASWMVQGRTPLYEVQEILGHSSPMLTKRYAHLDPKHLRTAVEAIDEVLREGPYSVPTRGGLAAVK